MARLLLFFVHADHSAGASAAVGPLVQLLVVALVVAAILVSLCTSSTHAKLWKQRGTTSAPVADSGNGGVSSRKHMLAASLSGIGGKAAAMAKMVSWNRRSPAPGSSSNDEEEEEAAVEDEEAVWRKAIIMGEKCRPLQFSGHIAFDVDGNQLTPAAAKKAADDIAAQN